MSALTSTSHGRARRPSTAKTPASCQTRSFNGVSSLVSRPTPSHSRVSRVAINMITPVLLQQMTTLFRNLFHRCLCNFFVNRECEQIQVTRGRQTSRALTTSASARLELFLRMCCGISPVLQHFRYVITYPIKIRKNTLFLFKVPTC